MLCTAQVLPPVDEKVDDDGQSAAQEHPGLGHAPPHHEQWWDRRPGAKYHWQPERSGNCSQWCQWRPLFTLISNLKSLFKLALRSSALRLVKDISVVALHNPPPGPVPLWQAPLRLKACYEPRWHPRPTSASWNLSGTRTRWSCTSLRWICTAGSWSTPVLIGPPPPQRPPHSLSRLCCQ